MGLIKQSSVMDIVGSSEHFFFFSFFLFFFFVVCDSPLPEAAFVDVRKGSKASVKVEFRVVGLELTEQELKAVGDAFDQQEAEEAAVNRAAMEEELKKAALKAVKEKMRSAAPVSVVEAEEEKKTKEAAA